VPFAPPATLAEALGRTGGEPLREPADGPAVPERTIDWAV
jgi:hypothetical protein